MAEFVIDLHERETVLLRDCVPGFFMYLCSLEGDQVILLGVKVETADGPHYIDPCAGVDHPRFNNDTEVYPFKLNSIGILCDDEMLHLYGDKTE